jgi:uncharacterized protein YndB with AHSA1/START domain
MADERPDVVERELWIDAPPEVVFEFFTDARKLLQWIGKSVELDARRGGVFRLDINGRDVVRGEFVEVLPPQRVVFTWGWEDPGDRVPPGSTTVEVTLEPDGAGTRLRLRHRGLSGRHRERHEAGWAHYLPRLAKLAEEGDPGPDPMATLAIHHG